MGALFVLWGVLMCSEENNKQVEKTKFDKGIKIVELIIKAIALFLSTSVFITICTDTQIGNIINNYSEEKSVEQKLIEAQNYYLDGYYIKAYEIYAETKNESSIASINLGYLYSNGLGCKANFGLACRYYKQAYEQGLIEGLWNYLAINLNTPNSYEETIAALIYGFENDNEVAIQYLSYFESGEMYAELNENCKQKAQIFVERETYEQIDMLKEKLCLRSAEMVRFEDENIPKDTDFKTYTKYDDFLEHIGNKSIRLPIEENGTNIWVLKSVNTYQTSSYYVVSYFRFIFADYFEEECFYKI